MASDAPPPADAAVRVRRRRQKRESEGRSKQAQEVRRYPQTTSLRPLSHQESGCAVAPEVQYTDSKAPSVPVLSKQRQNGRKIATSSD